MSWLSVTLIVPVWLLLALWVTEWLVKRRRSGRDRDQDSLV